MEELAEGLALSPPIRLPGRPGAPLAPPKPPVPLPTPPRPPAPNPSRPPGRHTHLPHGADLKVRFVDWSQ